MPVNAVDLIWPPFEIVPDLFIPSLVNFIVQVGILFAKLITLECYAKPSVTKFFFV